MNIKLANDNKVKKVIIGTVAAIGICTLSFVGISQTVKAAAVNKTEVVPTTYSAIVSNVQDSNVPEGYVKANYKLELSKYSTTPATKSISAEAAAELGAQDLWRLFGVDMNNKTIEMCYQAVSPTMPRAKWEGIINIDKNLNYWFTVDAITGENNTTGQNKYWSGDINIDFNKTLDKNPEQYLSLATELAEKHQFVSGKVVAAEYESQGYSTNNDGSGKNSDIIIMVKSENGQQAQLLFSTYNQEFLQVSYDSCVKEMKAIEAQVKEELEQRVKEETLDKNKGADDSSKLIIDTVTKQISSGKQEGGQTIILEEDID